METGLTPLNAWEAQFYPRSAVNNQTQAPTTNTVSATGANVPQVGFGGAGGFLGKNGGLGTILGGAVGLGNLWLGFQQHKQAKKAFAQQTKAYETNLRNQTQTYNTGLTDRANARFHQEGRSEQAESYINKHKL